MNVIIVQINFTQAQLVNKTALANLGAGEKKDTD